MQTKHASATIWTTVAIAVVIMALALVYGLTKSNYDDSLHVSTFDGQTINKGQTDYRSNVKGPGTTDAALGLPASASANMAVEAYLKDSAGAPDGSGFKDSYTDLAQ